MGHAVKENIARGCNVIQDFAQRSEVRDQRSEVRGLSRQAKPGALG